jgi:CheY-like chemotaxis protein
VLILIADDDPVTVELVGAILKGAGHDTIVARDALQAVTFANQRRPDVIVLDVMMPAGTGIGALEKLRLSTKTAAIPVIVLSGVQDAARIERVRTLGAAFLGKPVNEDELLAALAAVRPVA